MTEESSQREMRAAFGRGFRTAVTILIVGVIAITCAIGLSLVLERRVVAPTCTAYGAAHGLTYTGYTSSNSRNDDGSGTVCQFAQPDGNTTSASTQGMLPFLTDLAVRFGLDLEITIPVFAILLVALWALFRRRPPVTP